METAVSSNNGALKKSPIFKKESFEDANVIPLNIDLENVYIPNWGNKPEARQPIISLADTSILTHQNVTTVIAHPGIGKSSICESIIAAYLNPNADCLGFAVTPTCIGLLYIDNERTNNDVWDSFYRIYKRAKIERGQEIDNVTIAGLRAIPRLAQRKKIIEHLLQTNKYGLLLLDGAGDLVNDPNSLEVDIELRIWLRELTIKYHISIFITIHPNPGSEKPRGHVGSEACRESECVIIAKAFSNDIRIITSDFEHGKNRNNPNLTVGYRWSDEDGMFISASVDSITDDMQAKKDFKRRTDAEKLALKIIAPPIALSHTEVLDKMMRATNKSKSTAKRSLDDWMGWDIVKKHEDGFYRYNL